MDDPWLYLVLTAAAFVAVVLLTAVCLDCSNRGPLVSIRQVNASEEYMPATEFRIIHPSQPITDMNSILPPSNLLSPFSPLSSDPGAQRRQRSFTSTETESNPSYENTPDVRDLAASSAGLSYPESYAEDYITVLPDPEASPSNQSQASTPSSGNRHEYENVVPACSDSRDYLNLDTLQCHMETPDPAAQIAGNDDDDDEDDDDEEGNYVNQSAMIDQPGEPSA